MFETFSSWSFMFNRLKRPLIVTVRANGNPEYDDLGNLVSKTEDVLDVEEPLITNAQMPSISASGSVEYDGTSGGSAKTLQTIWVSKQKDMPKLTKVYDVKTDKTYQVIGATENMVSNLTYYQLKRVERTEDNV